MWILLDGQVELTQQFGHEATVMTIMTDPGQWAGGHAAWGSDDENAVFLVTGHALTSGHCYVVPAPALRQFVERWLPLSRHILDAVYQTVRRVDATARRHASRWWRSASSRPARTRDQQPCVGVAASGRVAAQHE